MSIPSFCSTDHPNSAYTTYTASWGTVYNIWQCYHARFDPHSGIVYEPIYYEEGHPEASVKGTVQEVKDWIEANLGAPPPPPPEHVTLTMSVVGNGSTEPEPGVHTYPNPSMFGIRARPSAGETFQYWEIDGANAGAQNPKTLVLNRDLTVIAHFSGTGPPPTYANVTISVVGSGTTNPPAGNYLSTYLVGNDLYVTATPASGWHFVMMRRNGVNWTTSSPGEFLNLQATENIEVVFDETSPPPPPGKGNLEVHVFEDGSEVAASVDIVGVVVRTSPFVEVLDPGSYDLSVTFKGVVKTDTVVIVESETTKADYSYTASTNGTDTNGTDFPFKNLKRFPRLYNFVYGIWAKRKGKSI